MAVQANTTRKSTPSHHRQQKPPAERRGKAATQTEASPKRGVGEELGLSRRPPPGPIWCGGREVRGRGANVSNSTLLLVPMRWSAGSPAPASALQSAISPCAPSDIKSKRRAQLYDSRLIQFGCLPCTSLGPNRTGLSPSKKAKEEKRRYRVISLYF